MGGGLHVGHGMMPITYPSERKRRIWPEVAALPLGTAECTMMGARVGIAIN